MPLFAVFSKMSPSSLMSCACLATVIIFGIRKIHLWYRMRHIPGPTSAGWSMWWQITGALSGRYHEHLRDACEEYGSLVRIGPNQLVTSDPAVVRHLSSVRNTYTKGNFYSSGRIVPGVDNVVSVRNEARHKAMRTQMTPAFSMRAGEDSGFEAGINRQLLNFFALLDRKYLSTTNGSIPVDLAEKTQFLALDVIGDISVGKPFGYLEHDEDLYDYNQINMTSLPVMNVVSVFPWLTNIVHRWPFCLALPKEGDAVGFGRLMGFVSSFVEARLDSKNSGHKDMMQISIDNGMSKADLIQQGFIAIIAGSNSTAHTMRMILLSLITSPAATASLLKEIRSVRDTVSIPISWAEIQNLPYLQATVREGLRMWPPVAGLGFKVVPPEGDNINGYFVPGGTEIGQGYYAIGRSKAVWGDDADVFRPERWLTASESDLRGMIATVDTHFGGGKYSCLGKPIAMMEMHKGIFEIIRRYDISLVNPETPIKTHTSVFLFASDFWVTIRKREL